MTFHKELTTKDESETLGKKLARSDKYATLFTNADLSNNAKTVVEEWAKWRMYQMTLKSNSKRLHEIRADLMREIRSAGSSNRVRRKDAEAFRRFVCQEVTKRCEELLNNNFQARLNAVIVLTQLDLVDADLREDVPAQAYVKGAIPLLEVLETPTGGELNQQLEAIKVQAAIGLGRINLLGSASDLNISVQGQNLRNYTAKTLIAELKNPNSHPWYQKRLIDALGAIDMVNDITTGQPIIVQVLGEVLADRERPYIVRARAARALGRCRLPVDVNIDKLVYQILLLEYEMAEAYQKNPNLFYWLDCFEDVYYAFHAVSEVEIKQYGIKRPPGLNQKNLGNQVRDAYKQLLPVAAFVVKQNWSPPKEPDPTDEETETPVGTEEVKWPDNKQITKELIPDLGQWLIEHKPASHKLTPSLPDLDPNGPVPMGNAAAAPGS